MRPSPDTSTGMSGFRAEPYHGIWLNLYIICCFMDAQSEERHGQCFLAKCCPVHLHEVRTTVSSCCTYRTGESNVTIAKYMYTYARGLPVQSICRSFTHHHDSYQCRPYPELSSILLTDQFSAPKISGGSSSFTLRAEQ